MSDTTNQPQRENLVAALKKYKTTIDENKSTQDAMVNKAMSAPSPPTSQATLDYLQTQAPQASVQPAPEIVKPKFAPAPNVQAFSQSSFEQTMSRETDPDLIMSYEVVPLPSRGVHYTNKISEVNVEYMTSKDEDLLTTPSLIENGSVLDILLKRKIKTPGVNVDEFLSGDRDAIVLFLRTSSYGSNYNVQVPDPRTGVPFKTSVDLTRLRYKEVVEQPDERGHFSVFIPMRKKNVLIRLMSGGDETRLLAKAKAIQEAYGQENLEYGTFKLKSSIFAIEGNTDRSYIDRFVDAMPALDAYTIRKKLLDVSPGVDMTYEFTANDGYKFKALLSVDIDFFFPSN